MLPIWVGFQVHEAVYELADPVANLEMHPAILFPLRRKVTFDATVTVAEIAIAVRYGALLTLPAIVSAEKEDVSKTSVTVTVTVSYPALLDESTPLKTTIYVLFAPTSVGASKSGAVTNASEAEVVERRVIENFNLSSPPSIVIVALSSVVMVPTAVVFSGVLKVSAEGKAGGVVSGSTPWSKKESADNVPYVSVPGPP
jgi:hypothetical protein